MRRRTYDVEVESVDPAGPAPDELCVTTYNIWYDDHFAELRYHRIAAVLSRDKPDVMVFQEVTRKALDVFLDQFADGYSRAAAVGERQGNYGLLLLSRRPIIRATYTRLPTRADRGYLRAEIAVDGGVTVVYAVHLDSGKRWKWRRAWQLWVLFRRLRRDDDAIVLGDFNMRDDENHRIRAPYRDVWPMLRPDEPGYTEDTSINHMRFDMKGKPRHVRFDRALVKGWEPTGVELLGTEPVSTELPRIFPSDHFGVLCRVRRAEVTSRGERGLRTWMPRRVWSLGDSNP